MIRPIARSRLGQNILVVVDRTPGFLDQLETVTARLPNLQDRSFTLLCCCPTRYWEHSGADNADVQHDAESVWQEEEHDFDLAERYLSRARAVLQDQGVPSSRIRVKTGTDDSTIESTMAEIRRSQYSGILVGRSHQDVVNRLLGRGLTDIFRQVPKADVWVMDDD